MSIFWWITDYWFWYFFLPSISLFEIEKKWSCSTGMVLGWLHILFFYVIVDFISTIFFRFALCVRCIMNQIQWNMLNEMKSECGCFADDDGCVWYYRRAWCYIKDECHVIWCMRFFDYIFFFIKSKYSFRFNVIHCNYICIYLFFFLIYKIKLRWQTVTMQYIHIAIYRMYSCYWSWLLLWCIH